MDPNPLLSLLCNLAKSSSTMANLLLHRFPSIQSPVPPRAFCQFALNTSNFAPFPRGTLIPSSVRCMATPRRVKMVAKQIMRELSDMLLTDKNLQSAVLPEAALGADRYLSSLTTISDVEISSDLQVVKVYVSIFGDERGRDVALSGLKAKAKYVRAQLGRRMKLRLTPEVRFIEDESFERGSRVIAILDKIKGDGENKGTEIEGKQQASDDDWEEDDGEEDEDGDIIYVK